MSDQVPDTINCVECGGPARRISHPPPDEGFTPGDVIAYVCVECSQRLDLVYEEPDDRPD